GVRGRGLCRHLYRGGRAVGSGRRLSHGGWRNSVRRRSRGDGGGGGRDDRSDLHLPDRKERDRRVLPAPGRPIGGKGGARLSRRRLQLLAVSTAGGQFFLLASPYCFPRLRG